MNDITENDVLRYVKDTKERLGMCTLSAASSDYSQSFSGYMDSEYTKHIFANSIEELERKAAKYSPDNMKRERLKELEAEAEKIRKELGEEAS